MRAGHVVVLSTEELNLPAQDRCRYGDRILVKRTRGSQPAQPLFVLCGTRLFRPIFITDSTLVTLDFTSDCFTAQAPSEGRFKLRFEQIPSFT